MTPDVKQIRQDFPILQQLIRQNPLVYFDNAASTQKPLPVINAINHIYREQYANVHRGAYYLSEQVTAAYEAARVQLQHFLNARSPEEIIFVRGATEAINLVAQSYGRSRLQAGDEIIISAMEHHSNIVPWQLLCQQIGAVLKIIPINDAGELLLEEYQHLLSERTRLVAIVHLSNALGTINPVKEMIDLAHQKNIPVLVDGAQSAPHMGVDVQALDCDFFVCSAHKMYGPSGVGVLYGKAALLDAMPPYQGGGDMIRQVSFTKTTYNDLPYKFEAGTPNIEGAIAFGAAVQYLKQLGLDWISQYEHDLLMYATKAIKAIPGIQIIGTAAAKNSILSFVMAGVHPHDIATILDHSGIAIRSGHHCAMPLMERFNVPATARASFAFYNTRDEVDIFITALQQIHQIFK